MNEFSKADVPLGFSAALAKNIVAMKHFAMMTDDERKKVIEATKTINSKKDMQSYVDTLGRIE